MDNPQELKKAILATLAEKGDYKTLLEHIGDEPNLKKEVLSVLAEQGDYSSILKALNNDQKKSQTEEAFSKIAPLFQFSEMITKDAKGSFMQDLQSELDEKTTAGLQKLSEDIDGLREELKEATTTLFTSTKSDLMSEHLVHFKEAETALGNKMLALAVEVTSSKADEMFSSLAQEAKLTESDIEDIIALSALSVESQIASIISEYISETKITPKQIKGFAEAVRELLPEAQKVSWNQIVDKPEISPGGTSGVLVKQMIDAALSEFTPGGGGHTIQDEGTPLTQRTNLNFVGAGVTVTDDAGNGATVVTIPSGGGAGLPDGDYGDITVSGSTTALTIDNDVVSNAKLANMTTKTYKGRTSGTTGDPEDVPVTTLKTDLALTQADVGLGSVDNTSDANKPVSTATQTALNLKQNLSEKDTANGYAGLDSGGKLNPSQLPALAISDTFVVASQAAQVALTAEVGDVAVRTDQNKSYILRVSPATVFANWQELLTPTDSVASVFSRTGIVTAQNGDYTASQVTNVPAGSIGAVTVQAALNELDTEKSAVGHTHLLAAGATDVTITAANLNTLDDGVDSTLHFHATDRARANHTGTQLASTISDFAATVRATILTGISFATSTAVVAGDTILAAIGKLQAQNTTQDTAIALNTAKVTNATHTGEVTGSGALTVDKTAITNKTNVTAAVGDSVLISDVSDSDNLKKVTVQSIVDLAAGGGGGNIYIDTYYRDQSGGTSDTYGALSGTINGSNSLFTVSQGSYVSGTLKVFRNGQLQVQGSSSDWTETTPASGTFTFIVPPVATPYLDEITVEYQKTATTSINEVAVVAARIYRNSNQSIPTGAGWTDLSWSTAGYEVGGDFWTSGATTTIPESGYYQIFAEATFDGTGLLGAATANMQILLNGATVIGDDEKQVIINGKAAMLAMAQRNFTAGDTIKVQVKHSDSGSVNVLVQGDHSPDIIFLKANGAKGDVGPSGPGDVDGPASATDNAIARFDATTGKLIQNSNVVISDTGNITMGGSSLKGQDDVDFGNQFGTVASFSTAGITPVNKLNISAPNTGGNVILSAVGTDTNIGIDVTPKGNGDVRLGTMRFDSDQVIGAGQDNYVLTYDNSTSKISLEAVAAGGSPGGTINQLQYNNAGAFGGATSVDIEAGGHLRLDSLNFNAAPPATPGSGQVTIYGRKRAGRILPVIIDGSALTTVLQPAFVDKKLKFAQALYGSSTLSIFNLPTGSATGTATVRNLASGSYWNTTAKTSYVSAAAINSACGVRFGANSANPYLIRGSVAGSGGFFVSLKYGVNVHASTMTLFAGLSAYTTIQAATIQASAYINIIGVGADSGDTNLQVMHNDGTGTATKIDLGANFPAKTSATDLYEVRLFCLPNSADVNYYVERLNTGDKAEGVISTNLPANTQGLIGQLHASTLTGVTAIDVAFNAHYSETDN